MQVSTITVSRFGLLVAGSGVVYATRISSIGKQSLLSWRCVTRLPRAQRILSDIYLVQEEQGSSTRKSTHTHTDCYLPLWTKRESLRGNVYIYAHAYTGLPGVFRAQTSLVYLLQVRQTVNTVTSDARSPSLTRSASILRRAVLCTHNALFTELPGEDVAQLSP